MHYELDSHGNKKEKTTAVHKEYWKDRLYLKLERTHKDHQKLDSLLLAGLNKAKPYD